MFQPGDLVVYGSTGVCRVEEITHPNMTGADRNKAYYLLKPLYQDGVIYTPAENSKVAMRPVISSEEAEELIDLIPTIQAEAQKRRLGMVDERYMKQAEQLLHGELAAALGIPMEEVQPYIARRVSGETPAGTAKG